MSEPENLIIALLRDMRSEYNARFDRIERRLDAIEKTQISFRQALSSDTLMSRLVTGDFEERIEALEIRVKSLESRK